MHPYRTHDCGALRLEHVGQNVRLSGWVHRTRDHGGVLFVDLRDHYGITQCVADADNPAQPILDSLRNESVITVTGEVVKRSRETVNDRLPTGEIELVVRELTVQSRADVVPVQVNAEEDAGEETRLRYRYLDLRRARMQRNIKLRSDVIASIRRRMVDQGFNEIQTPILTASSPEGARDYLVPARLHPGQFYALPQAPQQFKQLLMMAGFDKYFQIAPCFRDEDARADRSPGEFYQLDVEMSFCTQDDVFAALEPVFVGVFEEFSGVNGTARPVSPAPFRRIPYEAAMLRYGSDKPDLRNPLEITDVTEVFAREDVTFKAFRGQIDKGGVVRAIVTANVADRPRSFFDKLNDWARGEGAPGLGYIIREGGEGKGPIAKFVPEAAQQALIEKTGLADGGAIWFVCDQPGPAAVFAGKARTRLGEETGVIDHDRFEFCWVVDFPMFELDEETGKIDFSHNPFSMPQGELAALENEDPLTIKAWQYDIVCNGVELSSGAIRNHKPEIMEKAFEIAGYDKAVLEEKFGGMLNAMRYGAPPHGGSAPGIDRIVMLIAGEANLREVVAFPMNQQAQDLLMGAPSTIEPARYKELWIKPDLPKPKIEGIRQ